MAKRGSRVVVFLCAVVAGCGAEPASSRDDAGGGGPDGGADPDAGPDPDAGAPASLQESLAGEWELDALTCADHAVLHPYDGARVSLAFDGSVMTLSLARRQCRTQLPFDVTYDEQTASFTAAPGGVVSCLPEGCGEGCGEALAFPPLAGAVVFDGPERFILTSGEGTLPAMMCDPSGLALPAVQSFRRSDAPFVIDDSVCDVDPYAAGRTVYYVAQNEPGADNEACDGLAPADEGGGHCPFRDFTSASVRAKLVLQEDGTPYVRSITVAVREGTYFIEPVDLTSGIQDIPLWIESDASSPEEAVVLTRYGQEHVVLDGTCPAGIPTCDSPEDPGRIWQLLSLQGRFIVVRGLELDNAHKWNITVAARDTCVVDNTLVGSYGSDSDSIKSFEDSGPNVIIRGNDIHTGFEQALDGTMAYGWLIEDNDVHDGADRGIGFKLEARDSVVRDNRFWNIPGMAMALGGTSSEHVFPEEGLRLVAEGNVVSDVGGLVEVFSCRDCAVRNNVVDGGRVGIDIRDDDEPSGCPGGCALSTGLELRGNRLRGLTGDDPSVEEGAPPNVFVILRDEEHQGFVAEENLYCLVDGAPALFGLGTTGLDFSGWRGETGLDASSQVMPSDDPECAGSW